MISLKQFAQMRLRKRIIKQLIKMPGAYKFCDVPMEYNDTYFPDIIYLADRIERYIHNGIVSFCGEQNDSE